MAPVAKAVVDLDAPWERERIVEVRTSRMKAMRGMGGVMTGIYKEKRGVGGKERIWCGREGLEGDEHDLTCEFFFLVGWFVLFTFFFEGGGR